MKKTIIFWLTFVLAMAIALYFAVRVSMAVLGMGNLARVQTISIRSGLGANAAGEISDALQISTGKAIYSVNLNDLLEKITNRPGISDAAIRRTPGGKILIRANARKIIAAWTDGVGFYPLSADGRVAGAEMPAAPADTLVFSGELPGDVGKFAESLHANATISKNLDRIEWIGGRRWNLYAGGIKIMLPENNADAALSKLTRLQKQSNILNRNLSIIDLRDGERTLVVTRH